jgi:hypothetical protein
VLIDATIGSQKAWLSIEGLWRIHIFVATTSGNAVVQLAVGCPEETRLFVATIGDEIKWSAVSCQRLSRHAYLLAASDYWW